MPYRRRSALRRIVATAIVVTILTGPVLLFSRRELTLLLWATALFALGLLAVRVAAAEMRRAGASPYERALAASPPEAVRPSDLKRIERELAFGAASRAEYDAHTRPLLRRAIAARLLEQRAVDLDAQPVRAREILPPDLWRVVCPEEDPRAGGIEADDLVATLEQIEHLGLPA
jgi:hypothetical protein